MMTFFAGLIVGLIVGVYGAFVVLMCLLPELNEDYPDEHP